MNLKKLKFLLPAAVGVASLIAAPAALADAGNPASIVATYNSTTGLLSASGTYSSAPTGGSKRVGFALFIDGANPVTPGVGSLDGVDTNTMHVLPTPTTASGAWSDNSHTLVTAPATVCVVIYDVHTDKIGDDGNHSDIPAGSDRNEDNSYERNHDSFPADSCVTPTIVSNPPSTPPTGGGPSGGGPSSGGESKPACPQSGPQQVDQVWFTDVKPGEVTVHWANKGDASGFHIAYGPAQDNLIWGVEVDDHNATQFTLGSLPGGDLWVAVIAKSSKDCGGPISPIVKVSGPQVLGATGVASSTILFSAGFGLIALGLWQTQKGLKKGAQRA